MNTEKYDEDGPMRIQPARPVVTVLLEAGRVRSGPSWPIRDGFTVGRQSTCDLVVADRSVSEVHLRVHRTETLIEVEDNHSTNGTVVDGRPVERAPVCPGSVVRVGESLLLFELESAEDERPCPDTKGLVRPGRLMRRTLRQMAEALTDHRSPRPVVRLMGEQGCGKDVLAEVLHRLSGRPGSFVRAVGQQIEGARREAELHGWVRGAFPDAHRDQRGLFAQADRGTLFLNEIGTLPEDAQNSLLTIVERSEVKPIGAERATRVDVQLVVATNQDLEAMVSESKFRADLLSRFSGHVIEVPPLRARRDEVLHLFLHYLGAAWGAEASGQGLRGRLAERLVLAQWPANVRGLTHAAARVAVAGVRKAVLGLADLHGQPFDTFLGGATQPAASPWPCAVPAGRGRADSELADLLRQFQGDVDGMAKSMGTPKSTVYRWIKKAGLVPRDFRP